MFTLKVTGTTLRVEMVVSISDILVYQLIVQVNRYARYFGALRALIVLLSLGSLRCASGAGFESHLFSCIKNKWPDSLPIQQDAVPHESMPSSVPRHGKRDRVRTLLE